jgi:hypothetical protein
MERVVHQLKGQAKPALKGAPKGVPLASIGKIPHHHKGLTIHGGQPAVVNQSHDLLIGIGRWHGQHQPNPWAGEHGCCQEKDPSPGQRVEGLKERSQGLKRCRTRG